MWITILLLMLVPFGLRAQMNMAGHSMEMRNELPPEQLPPPQKLTGIGNVHMQITANPEAQSWFDQGLNSLHDFWDYESARAFEQGVRVDPQCAMCYWGLYQAEAFYHSVAKGYADQALQKAMSLKNHVSERERLCIEATSASKSMAGEKSGKPGATRAETIWRQLVQQYPADTELKIFLSGDRDKAESLQILQSILKDAPDNSAANHYYIHALEGTDHPEQALHSAEILSRLAPASGHMVHMPGHIYFRIGDYERAEQAFAASRAVDERYMREQQVTPDNDWNYVHNLMYAVANYLEEGKMKQASEYSAQLSGARGDLESTLYIYSARDSISRLDPLLPMALRTADWAQVDTLLSHRQSSADQPHLNFLATSLQTIAAGMRATEAHDFTKANELSTRLDAELWRTLEEESKSNDMKKEAHKMPLRADALLEPIVSTLSIMSLELRASLFAAQGKTAESRTLFAHAAEREKALGYHEPPNYIRPVAESEGASMGAAGDWADAKAAYKKALVKRPHSGLVLYGLALANEKSGDRAAAVEGYTVFLAAWKTADADLPQLAHAHSYLGSR